MTGGGDREHGGGLRSAWRHGQFRYLLASYAISGAGDFVYVVALIAYVLNRTGSETWVGATVAIRFLPSVLLGPIGGVMAGRYDRRRLMVTLDLVRAAIMAALSIAAATGAHPAVLLVFAFCANAATTPYRSAVAAVTPTVVGEEDLAASNAAEALVNQLAFFVGPVLGGALYAATSATWSFAVNGLTFACSAALVSRVNAARRAPTLPGVAEIRNHGPGWRGDLRAGWRTARRTTGVSLVSGLLFAALFANGFEMVLYPLVASRRLGLGPEGVGYLIAATGIGGLLAAPATTRMGASTRPGLLLSVSAVLMGVPLAVLAAVSTSIVAYGLLLVGGAGAILFEIVAITLLQRLVAGDDLARVFGLIDAGIALAIITGATIAPALVRATSLNGALVTGGVALSVVGVLALPRFIELDAATAARAAALAPSIDVLARLGLFQGASRPALERIAAAITEDHVAAGSAIISEGDPPEDLYVIRSGTLGVSAVGQLGQTVELPALGTDDWFGEIGLLRSMPRTATVTASCACVIWRIPGAVFLDTLATLEARPIALQNALYGRLARTHPALARLEN